MLVACASASFVHLLHSSLVAVLRVRRGRGVVGVIPPSNPRPALCKYGGATGTGRPPSTAGQSSAGVLKMYIRCSVRSWCGQVCFIYTAGGVCVLGGDSAGRLSNTLINHVLMFGSSASRPTGHYEQGGTVSECSGYGQCASIRDCSRAPAQPEDRRSNKDEVVIATWNSRFATSFIRTEELFDWCSPKMTDARFMGYGELLSQPLGAPASY